MFNESRYHNIVRTLDAVAEALEARGSKLSKTVDTVADTILEDLYEELDRTGFDDFTTRDEDVAVEIYRETPSLLPDISHIEK